MKTYRLDNIYKDSNLFNPVIVSRIIGGKKWHTYRLYKAIRIELSNKTVITIPRGFTWDLSSVPRLLWAVLPPDGNFIIAALIHDYLYQNWFYLTWLNSMDDPRKFTDNEMLLWSKAMNGTKKLSIKKIDNYTRFYGVRLFGTKAWITK